MARDDLRRGAIDMVGSALLFSLMSVGVKMAAFTLPNTVVVFFRSGVGLLALLPVLDLGNLGTRRLSGHLVRALAGTAAMYCFFYALAHMRLADAVLLNYSMPLFMPFIESAWEKEPFPRRLWGPVLLGFAGIVVILRPGWGLFRPVALIGLASAVLAALAQVGVRRLTDTEPVTRIVFYFASTSTLVCALPLPWTWTTPSGSTWLAILGMGVSATAAQLLMTRGYSAAPAAQVGPFIYTAVVFAGILDWLVWKKLPDGFTVAGSVLVILAGILALRRQPGEAIREPV